MCGIVGYGGFSKRVSLEKAIKAIKHRGPDDNGVTYIDDVALGNTRLAIIDLSKIIYSAFLAFTKIETPIFLGKRLFNLS